MKVQIFTVALLIPALAFANGSGRMDTYGGGLDAAGLHEKEQFAVEFYNAGVELRDEALSYEKESDAVADAKQKEKLLKKAGKSFEKAAGKFEKAVQYNPELYQAWSAFGHALRKTGDYERSLEAYKNALALEPNYHEAIEYQAEAHLHLAQYEKVKAAYARLLREKPEFAEKLLGEINKWLPGQDVNANADLKAFAQWAKDMSGGGNPAGI
ncbi:MAG TPA: tetratricopeptide repeat protein [Gammaproteobacteria bacterium]|nr:tetratricopeptide repeat protein [Gammaproteobacteria bacterium]